MVKSESSEEPTTVGRVRREARRVFARAHTHARARALTRTDCSRTAPGSTAIPWSNAVVKRARLDAHRLLPDGTGQEFVSPTVVKRSGQTQRSNNAVLRAAPAVKWSQVLGASGQMAPVTSEASESSGLQGTHAHAHSHACHTERTRTGKEERERERERESEGRERERERERERQEGYLSHT